MGVAAMATPWRIEHVANAALELALAHAVGYALARSLHRRQRRFWLSPIIAGAAAAVLRWPSPAIPHYADYAHDTGWLVSLLGPATVAFAVPIWTQRALLARHWLALGAGMLAGSAMVLFSSATGACAGAGWPGGALTVAALNYHAICHGNVA